MSLSTSGRDPFDVLRDYESRSLQDSTPDPASETEGGIWTGIAYRLADRDFVTALGEIREVINPPEMTMVPGARDWILGLANVHGTLLPIVDLLAWLRTGERNPETADTRVIVAQRGQMLVGVVVDSVLGMRHFQVEDMQESESDGGNPLGKFCKGSFGRSGRNWDVLSFEKLLTQPEFIEAAVAA